MAEMPDRSSVLLSVQKAMLGRVTDNLVAVTVGLLPGVVRLRMYASGPIDDEVQECSAAS